jgi:hypothetical protein
MEPLRKNNDRNLKYGFTLMWTPNKNYYDTGMLPTGPMDRSYGIVYQELNFYYKLIKRRKKVGKSETTQSIPKNNKCEQIA